MRHSTDTSFVLSLGINDPEIITDTSTTWEYKTWYGITLTASYIDGLMQMYSMENEVLRISPETDFPLSAITDLSLYYIGYNRSTRRLCGIMAEFSHVAGVAYNYPVATAEGLLETTDGIALDPCSYNEYVENGTCHPCLEG